VSDRTCVGLESLGCGGSFLVGCDGRLISRTEAMVFLRQAEVGSGSK
jgi:hypothetical protein